MVKIKPALVLTFFLSTALSILLFQYLGSTIFFDKFYYKKSPLYGYITDTEHPLIKKRALDVVGLVLQSRSPEEDFFTEQDSDTYVIAIISDSQGFGTGVKQSQIFPERLEKQLNKHRSTIVYNFSYPAENIIEHFAKLELIQTHLQPDLTIYVPVNNDLLINTFYRYANQEELQTKLKQTCSHSDFNYSYNDPEIKYIDLLEKVYAKSFSPEHSGICYLKEFAKQLSQSKSIVFISNQVDLPPEGVPQEQQGQLDYDIIQTFKTTFADNSVPVYDTTVIPGFSYQPVSKMEGHPSAKTHKDYANILEKIITENEQFEF